MKTERFKIFISESIGEITAEIISPSSVKACIVLAHGAGADMDHRFMIKLAEHLAEAGFAVLRYNFPFTENKKARPDPAPIAEKTVQVVVQKAMELFPSIHIFAGGKSFGGRMTSQMVSKKPMDNLKGLVFFGFPLHPAGKPSIDRASHLAAVTVPMLFLQGTKDALAQMPLITQVVSTLPTSTLTIFEGADHGFSVGKKDVILPLTEATVSWYRKLF